MSDLYLAIGLLVAAASGLFWLAVRITARGPRYRCELLAIQLILGMALYTVHLWHQFPMARLLPFANLVILGNWFLPAAGFMGGLAWRRIADHPVRRNLFVASLLGVGFYSSIHPLLGSPPACDNLWEDEICLQTTSHTCSPASAATLLRAHGIPASEQEMVDLCLTREGTTWAGLYRGLKRKTTGTPWDVEFFQGSLDDLTRTLNHDGRPLIISVSVRPDKPVPADYVHEWGLTPGLPHSVVVLRMSPGTMVWVGDPAQGREPWPWRAMTHIWHGEAIRLVPRHGAQTLATR